MWSFAGLEGVIFRYGLTAQVGGDGREVNDEVILVVSSSGTLGSMKHAPTFRLIVFGVALQGAFSDFNHVGIDFSGKGKHDSLPGHGIHLLNPFVSVNNRL